MDYVVLMDNKGWKVDCCYVIFIMIFNVGV